MHTDGFRLERSGALWVARCSALVDIPGLGHAFSTRRAADGAEFDVGSQASDGLAREAVLAAAGLAGQPLARIRQIHGSKVVDAVRVRSETVEADAIVAEVNQGGELVAEMLRQVAPNIDVRMVRATRGKYLRAGPVAALYRRGLVFHASVWPELEDQMCDLDRDGLSNGASPDRLDALVWALTELMLNERVVPRIRALL